MPLRYEIRLRGRVGEHLAAALGLEAEVEPVSTVLSGPLSAPGLRDLLVQLEERGLEVVELRRLPDSPGEVGQRREHEPQAADRRGGGAGGPHRAR